MVVLALSPRVMGDPVAGTDRSPGPLLSPHIGREVLTMQGFETEGSGYPKSIVCMCVQMRLDTSQSCHFGFVHAWGSWGTG